MLFLQSQENYEEFEEFLLALEQDLASTKEITEDVSDEAQEINVADAYPPGLPVKG
jgi:hypothetical protein